MNKPKQKGNLVTVEDILCTDSIKDIINTLNEHVEDIQSIMVVSKGKDGLVRFGYCASLVDLLGLARYAMLTADDVWHKECEG